MTGSVDPLFALLIVAVTTGCAVALGRRVLQRQGGFGPALGRMLEWVGLTTAFLVGNVIAGIVITAAARAAGVFVSNYLSADATLVLLSALQATAWQGWAESGRLDATNRAR